MADIDKRLRYFNGQFLEQKDFRDEQEYHIDRQRRHNRLFHTYGIAEGLQVSGAVGNDLVTVEAGTALDDDGQQIVLTNTRTLDLDEIKDPTKEITALVVISYEEIGVSPATVGNQGEMTRTEERPKIELVLEEEAPSAGSRIRLARLTVSSSGKLAAPVDGAVRQSAAVRLGEQVTMKSLRLSSDTQAEADWPALASKDKNTVDVEGNLNVTGRVTSPSLTAAALGALTSINGIANPGGNIALTGNFGIAIASDSAGKQIVISGQAPVNIGGVAAAGGTVAVTGSGGITVTPDNGFAKRLTISGSAPASIAGVANAGGDIAFVGAGGIGITSDNSSSKRITISSAAPASIAGVTNAGGSIGIVGSSGISVTSDNTTKNITLAGSAPTSIAGVSNPGGAINIVGGTGITVTPDNSASKRITLAASLTATDVGALAASAYGFGNRVIVYTFFSQLDAHNATRTVTVGFRPRFVWVTGSALSTAAGWIHGGQVNGFADVENTIAQSCSGPSLTRMTAAPYIVVNAGTWNGSCARGQFSDTSASPNTALDMSIAITSISSTTMTLTFSRTSANNFPSSFSLNLYLACVG